MAMSLGVAITMRVVVGLVGRDVLRTGRLRRRREEGEGVVVMVVVGEMGGSSWMLVWVGSSAGRTGEEEGEAEGDVEGEEEEVEPERVDVVDGRCCFSVCWRSRMAGLAVLDAI